MVSIKGLYKTELKKELEYFGGLQDAFILGNGTKI